VLKRCISVYYLHSSESLPELGRKKRRVIREEARKSERGRKGKKDRREGGRKKV
jgi:hypothetical protein